MIDEPITGLVGAVVAVLLSATAHDSVLLAPAVTFAAGTAVVISPGVPLEETATSVTDAPTFTVHTSAHLALLPPTATTTPGGPDQARTVPGLTVSLPSPAIVAGRPTLPAYWGQPDSSAAAIVGAGHLRAIADPDPVWDPVAGGWAYPPPANSHGAGVGHARWSVRAMPNPDAFGGDSYWVGEPSAHDGTTGIAVACRSWRPDASTPGAPAWRSIYPYKPSVRKHVHYGAGGQALTITAGMRFNLHFVEHMWLDWGHNVAQPFTWVIAGLVMDYPSPGYTHTLLDAGRDPRSSGVPYYGENQVQTNRRVNENFGYRNLLAVKRGELHMASRTHQAFGVSFPDSAKARMFFGVFNGAHSTVGNYSPHGRFKRAGKISGGAAHRYYTLGRANGWLGLDYASHLVVFEIRFWHAALTLPDIDAQYKQLSATWRFGQYH